MPSRPPKDEPLLSPCAEEPPDGITKADFLAFQERTKTIRDEASSIPFEPRPAWFNTSISVVVKATFAKPGEMIKRGGVVSDSEGKWFFLHSTKLTDLSGPGFMLTEECSHSFITNGDNPAQ